MRARIDLYDKSITLKTFIQYKARINSICTHLLENGKSPSVFSVDDFARFLLNLQHKLKSNSHSTAEGYRSAILHFQRSREIWLTKGLAWAAEPLAKKLIAGYAYNNKLPYHKTQKTRGAVDLTMLNTILGHVSEHNPHLALPIELAFRVALRPHQLISLQGGSFRDGLLTVPDKRANAANRRPFITRKKILDPRAQEILTHLETATPIGIPYFYPLTTESFRRQFKAASSATGISLHPALKIDGPHSLRHGGMAYLSTMMKKEVNETHGTDRNQTSINHICKTLQVSPRMLDHYTRPNASRVANLK